MTYMNKNESIKFLLSLTVLAIISRMAIPPFFGHLPNFSALDAIALFCGAYIARQQYALLAILLITWCSDLIVNKWLTGHWTLFYSGFYWQYLSYMLIGLLGTTLKNHIQPLRITATSLSATLLFFIITNFGVWLGSALYPTTSAGLISCYIAAIPFLKNSLYSNLLFTLVLFGSMEWLHFYKKKVNAIPLK